MSCAGAHDAGEMIPAAEGDEDAHVCEQLRDVGKIHAVHRAWGAGSLVVAVSHPISWRRRRFNTPPHLVS